MLNKNVFIQNITSGFGLSLSDTVLVAVSGGSDSMALLHLFISSGIKVEAAHVNFMLRGSESDGDEVFVVDFCKKNNVVCHLAKYPTKEIAQQTGKSIEMAARDLRYDFFTNLIKSRSLKAVAVGHHIDDSIETFFINLLRGTGLTGLTGIKPHSGDVIRPLLNVTHTQIIDYCIANSIAWRTDSSNLTSDFVRNKIRNEIVPVFMSINPSFQKTMVDNMSRLFKLDAFVKDELDALKLSVVAEIGDTQIIPIKLLVELEHCHLFLFHLLHEKGFNASQIDDVINGLNGIAGKQYFSSTHRLVRDRENLIVLPIEELEKPSYWIEGGENEISTPLRMSFSHFDKPNDFKFSTSSACIHIDADCVDFPLQLRQWQQGDLFMPLGMTSYKKLSDFFIDNKFSIIEKENCWLMLSGSDIVWVVGHRLDDRFKVLPRTKSIIEIRLLS